MFCASHVMHKRFGRHARASHVMHGQGKGLVDPLLL